MAEQTRKRYTIEELAGSCPPAPVPDGVTPREEAAAKWLHDSLRGYWGWADALDDARELLAAIDGPDPDWADLREMARNAGLIRSADYDPRENRYGHRDEDGYLKDGLGWVLQEWRGRDRTRLRVDLVGPIDGVRRTATLVDPTPAEVLTAARLVGLGGAS